MPTVDRSIAEDQVRIVITLKDRRRLEKYIEHCRGKREESNDRRPVGSEGERSHRRCVAARTRPAG